MSLELVLVPLAIASVGAWKAARAADPQTDPGTVNAVQVNSRMRDGALVAAALGDLGLRVRHDAGGGFTAVEQQRSVTFGRDGDGLWHGVFEEPWTEAEALELLDRLDAAYGRRVQQELLARIRERAPQAGLRVDSESVEADESVTVMLTVGAGR